MNSADKSISTIPFCSALWLLLVMATSAGAASINGVYALGQPNRPIPPQILDNPNVDGLALRFAWDGLEPADGEFNWGPLDQEFAAAVAHGKVVSLIVMPGRLTPSWVYAAGAQSVSLPDCQGRFGAPTVSGRFPIPWDPVFLSKWQAFLRALGQRYGRNPAFVLMKITGLNAVSGETALSRGGPCMMSDASAWRAAGYTRERLMQAYARLLDTYDQAFPDQKFALMLVPRALPPLDDAGRVVRGPGAQSPDELIDMGIHRFGSKFVVQNNGLSSFWSWERIAQLRDRVTVGYQMLWNVTGDPQCRMGGNGACDPAPVLRGAVTRGIDTGASYLEIYLRDLLNPELQPIIAEAHQHLANSRPVSTTRFY
jgi:hypothetical protein